MLNLRNLRRRGGILLGAGALCAATFHAVDAQANHQNILFATSDPAVLSKVLDSIKGSDPARYRFDGTLVDHGRAHRVTYGALPLSAVDQVSASSFGDGLGKAAVVHSSITDFVAKPAFGQLANALRGVDSRLYQLDRTPDGKGAILTTSSPAAFRAASSAMHSAPSSAYRFDATLDTQNGSMQHVTYGTLSAASAAARAGAVLTAGGAINDSTGKAAVVHSTLTDFVAKPAFQQIQAALAGVDTRLYSIKQVAASGP